MRGEHVTDLDDDSMVDGSAPRARGTLRGPRRRTPRTAGSAPRARGTPPAAERSIALTGRISPACAGNTRPAHPSPRCRTAGDQPRVRGEHIYLVVRFRNLASIGSAPRARGTLCGTMICARYRRAGSAPRARGTQDQASTTPSPASDRISPACAGNTCTPGVDVYCYVERISPACVGNTNAGSGDPATPCTGSAPRARGTRFAERRRIV